MEGDCAPSEGMVSPPSKLKDLSTTEDTCEPETQQVGYPSVFPDTIGVTSCADNPMVCFQSDMSFPGDVRETSTW